jgi:hypothetical protein
MHKIFFMNAARQKKSYIIPAGLHDRRAGNAYLSTFQTVT